MCEFKKKKKVKSSYTAREKRLKSFQILNKDVSRFFLLKILPISFHFYILLVLDKDLHMHTHMRARALQHPKL